MSMLDALAGPIGGQIAGAVASRMGIPPALAQTAIAALTRAHPQPGDTVQEASQQTGIAPDMLSQIMGHLGGEAGLGQLSNVAQGQTSADGLPGGLGGLLGGLLGGR